MGDLGYRMNDSSAALWAANSAHESTLRKRIRLPSAARAGAMSVCCIALSSSRLNMSWSWRRPRWRWAEFQPPLWTRQLESIVQDDAQERSVDLKPAIVSDETELPELIHEKTDPWARCAYHLRQRFLRYFGDNSVRPVFFTVAGKQQKSASEPLLAGVEKLIYQAFLDSNVACQHETDEAVAN